MSRVKKDNYLSGILKKARPAGKGGVCKDTARCYLSQGGIKTEIYLGLWGSAESQEKYARIAAEFYGTGIVKELLPSKSEITVAFLCFQFLQDADRRVADPRLKFNIRDRGHYETAIKHVVELYADLPVSQFRTNALRTYRDYLVQIAPRIEKEQRGFYKSGRNPDGTDRKGQPKFIVTKKPWTQDYVVKITGYLKSVFCWGIGREMVDPVVKSYFAELEPLVSDLDITEARQDVKDDSIQKVLSFLSPTVRDMVIIQRQNCLRPGEVCDLRVGDIDRSGEIWTVKKSGKTTWKTGVPLIIKFCKSDQEIIARRIAGKGADEYVFTPKEAEIERWEIQRAKRKSKIQPSQAARSAAAQERKFERYRDHYTENAFYNAVRRGQVKAKKEGVKIPDFCLHQIRHTAVTVTSYETDRQSAAYMAGHVTLSMTERYSHEAAQVKEDLAKKRGCYWAPEETRKKAPLSEGEK